MASNSAVIVAVVVVVFLIRRLSSGVCVFVLYYPFATSVYSDSHSVFGGGLITASVASSAVHWVSLMRADT